VFPFRKALFLSSTDKLLAVQIVLHLCIAKLSIHVMPFAKIRSHLKSGSDTNPGYQQAQHLSNLTNQIAYHLPWQCNCLVRAVSCGLLLKKKQIGFTFHIGTKLEDGKLDAHAWLTLEDGSICGDAKASDYKEIFHFDSERSDVSFSNSI